MFVRVIWEFSCSFKEIKKGLSVWDFGVLQLHGVVVLKNKVDEIVGVHGLNHGVIDG
jgi:hypothetical protein